MVATHIVRCLKSRTVESMRIALFATCLADAMFPRAAVSTVQILERLGHEVVFPAGQTCCGQMHINTGYLGQATELRYDENGALIERKDAAGVQAYLEWIYARPGGCCSGVMFMSRRRPV